MAGASGTAAQSTTTVGRSQGARRRRIGILAGGGSLPHEIADSLTARGTPVTIVALAGEADTDFAPHDVTTVGWGQVGRMLATFKRAECTELVIVGSVTRPDLTRLVPDFGLIQALPSVLRIILSGGDDAVLRGVLRFFEGHGITVVGPRDVAPELIVGAGPLEPRGALAKIADAESLTSATDKAFAMLAALSEFDIGQAAVVGGDGTIEAIEGVEGTDRMIARVRDMRRTSGRLKARGHGALVKTPKRGQDFRVDLPVIGPNTVVSAAEANLAAIRVSAGNVLALDRAELLAVARAHDIAIEGVVSAHGATDSDTEGASAARGRSSDAWTARHIGGAKAARKHFGDVCQGAAVLDRLTPFETGAGLVVARRHVIAVESGEGVAAMFARAATHRQWGAQRIRLRRGVGVVRDADSVTPAVLKAVADSGLLALAIIAPAEVDAPVGRDIVQAAALHRLALLAVSKAADA